MNVRELIEKLSQLNPEAFVYIPETERVTGWSPAERVLTHAVYHDEIVYVTSTENS